MALATEGPGTEIIFRANEEYSSSYSPLKLVCITVVPCLFLTIQGHCKILLHGECKVKVT